MAIKQKIWIFFLDSKRMSDIQNNFVIIYFFAAETVAKVA
jgi:hypothetical protein